MRSAFNESWRAEIWQSKISWSNTKKQSVKADSWQSYCTSIESCTESARLSNILSKEHINTSFLKTKGGAWHPPLENPWRNSWKRTSLVRTTTCKYSRPILIVSKKGIIYAIKSFLPFKAAGQDGFIPIMVQKLKEPMVLRLEKMYKGNIQLFYITRIWQIVKGVYVPKNSLTQSTLDI